MTSVVLVQVQSSAPGFYECRVFVRSRDRAFCAPAHIFRLFAHRISALQRFAQCCQRLRHGRRAKIVFGDGILSITAYVFRDDFPRVRVGETAPAHDFLALEVLGFVAILFFPTDLTGSKKRTVSGVVRWLLAIANTESSRFLSDAPTILSPATMAVRAVFCAVARRRFFADSRKLLRFPSRLC